MNYLALLWWVACTHPIPPEAPPEVPVASPTLASLARSPCYGWCPVYSVVVSMDGSVDYTGVRFVKTIGEAHGQLSPTDVEALKKLFLDNYYFNMQDSYEQIEITDAPSAQTSFNDGTRSKSISHYYGDSSAPPELRQIEEGFDRIVGIEQWIGSKEERQNLARPAR